ncbi:MAG: glycosyltransferase family 39 protein [Planctomycetes bacterium]|nr:glycosyltransferase family 39 protein [Planctomycetota bacterium]
MTTRPGPALAVLVTLYFWVGASLHGLNGAEFLDSLRYMFLFHPPAFELRAYGRYFHPPFYSLLLEAVRVVVGEPEAAGKLVSNAMGALALLPLHALVARCLGKREGLLAAALYAVAALPWRWNLRVLSDATFTCLFLTALWGFARGHLDRSAGAMAAGIFAAGLAAATRNQGFALAPVAVALLWVRARDDGFRWAARAAVGWVSWIALAFTHLLRGWGWTAAFSGGGPPPDLAGRAVWCAVQLEFYVAAMPYLVGYPVAAAAAYGLLCMRRTEASERFYLVLGGTLWGMWFLVHAMVVGFTPRYFEPVLPLALGAAARGLVSLPERRRGAAAIACIAYSAAFTIAVLGSLRDELGDLARAGRFIHERLPDQRIVCAVEEPLARYYAGRMEGAGFVHPSEVNGLVPGDVVWVQTSMPRNGAYLQEIDARWETEILRQEKAEWVPLLEDAYGPDSQTAAWFYHRYTPRRSFSIVLRVLRKRP